MIHSAELGEIATALSAAQGEFEAVAKDSTNPFFKSAYAGLPQIVKAASPILTEHGLSVSQLLGHDESGDTLTTCVMHKSGQFIGDTMQLRPVKNDPQAQGSATTYGRRYAYMAALGLVADEDDDGNAGSSTTGSQGDSRSKPSTRAKPATQPKAQAKATEPATGAKGGADEVIDPERVTELRDLAKKAGVDPDTLKWKVIAALHEESKVDANDLRAAIPALTNAEADRLAADLSKTVEG